MGSVSAEGNVSDVSTRGASSSNKLGVFELNDNQVFSDRNGSMKNGKSEQQKVQRREEGRSKDSDESMPMMFDDFATNEGPVVSLSMKVDVSSGHRFEVGDMVWGKVKSHPWWPGHVYSEEFATPSVRRSKRDGLLLVAFFGDSSYGWFHSSELIRFDSNFSEKSCQTNLRTFIKAVEEAVDEVSRRSALGLSCLCRNKQNFRQTDVKGYFAVDVAAYEPGAVYSIDTIREARDSFQARMFLDFVRQLALEPTSSEHVGINFIKNKAIVMAYRKAVFEELDETYSQAFSASRRPVQALLPGKTPSKAPLSGRQVFADTSSKGKSPGKPSKPKDHSIKDKYIFKRRDDSIATGTTAATGAGASKEDTPTLLEIREPSKVKPPLNSSTLDTTPDQSGQPPKDRSVDNEKTIVPQMEDRNTSSGLVDGKFSTVSKVVSSGPKKVTKVSKRPIGEVGPDKLVVPQKKKKRKQESSTSSSYSHTSEPEEMTGLGNDEAELQRVLGDLHSLAFDPFHAINKGLQLNTRKVFLRYRSLVFQKSLNLADDDGNDTNTTKSLSENGVKVPLLKPQAGSSGRPHDPTVGGRKRGPSDHQEELAAKKKQKVGDIRNLTKEKKVINKTKEPPARAHVIPLKKTGPELMKTEKRSHEPTVLIIKFPAGGSLPSINELKARFARYGPMDHSATRILWNTFSCRVVYRHKIDAQAAYKFVIGSISLFGNTDVKCTLKEVGESEPQLKPPREDHQPATDERPTPQGAQPKSILKKPVPDKAAGSVNNASRGTPRVKFMLGEDESDKTKVEKSKNTSFSFSSSSDATMNVNSKNFHKTSNPLPLLPLPTSTSIINNITTTQLPPYSKRYNATIAPPLPPGPPPRSSNYGGNVVVLPPLPPHLPGNLRRPANVDITQQMLSLLTKCNDAVTNVTGLLGYVPYHPL